MKNPKANPEIEAIKERLKKDIGYLPEGNIPNSRVAKMVELLDATATLEYAKSIKRAVRRAAPEECAFSIELAAKRHKENTGYYDAKAAAKYLRISATMLLQMKKNGQISSHLRHGLTHFEKNELDLLIATNPFFAARAV